MRKAIVDGNSVDAITMDLASFYHRVSPDFLLRKAFLEQMGVRLRREDRIFTKHFVSAIWTWYRSTPDYADRPEGALPVGLSASKVIANVFLHQFDNEVSEHLDPLYYGRYVDDIFLVINPNEDAIAGDDVISFIADKVPCISQEDNGALRINFSYGKDSDLIFSGDKQKIFCLTSKHGLDLVDHIASQIRKHSSEYRLLPDVPDAGPDMASRALLATPSAALEADALRKADVVSVRRLGFSLLLGDVEGYSKDLDPKAWPALRKEFYGLVHRHLLTPLGIFEFTQYYSRIFSLMIACGDFVDATLFVDSLKRVFDVLGETTRDGTDDETKATSCKLYLAQMLSETALKASTARKFSDWRKLQKLFRKVFEVDRRASVTVTRPRIQQRSAQILLADFGVRPYKDYWYYDQPADADGPAIPRSRNVRKTLRLATIRKFRDSANLKLPHWPALAFPTRPLTINEIALVSPEVLDDTSIFQRFIWGLRGARVPDSPNIGFIEQRKNQKLLSVPFGKDNSQRDKIRIGLTSIKTSDEQWTSAACGTPDRSLARYKNIIRLINRILKDDPRPDYIVFPELSIPRRWAFSIAQKLAKDGISFIAGLEYFSLERRGVKKKLINDCMVSLATRWPGYDSSIVWLQRKLEPAHGEKMELKKLGKVLQSPTKEEKDLVIYDHGRYFFGILICSDMTNISRRSNLQGKIDTLFVLEWNPDLETFGFLVEGAAHDLHTFVVQVNNRTYGDSRIRAPYKEDHKRDSIQIKGGIRDFYVLGDIDYLSLRKFHNTRRHSRYPLFKPLPIGFEVARWRRR
ncbi:RNA-directed DNA polymerase [Geotalea toluenoxydans]|uniref:RNA-directed DNA polymerase n=1 Tax=Geotalea toluenoxydans TaxID=421624 RepID=UPI0006D2126A|nr:RNA-directed DNA polymerase [Geotalea toluenoxydans]